MFPFFLLFLLVMAFFAGRVYCGIRGLAGFALPLTFAVGSVVGFLGFLILGVSVRISAGPFWTLVLVGSGLVAVGVTEAMQAIFPQRKSAPEEPGAGMSPQPSDSVTGAR